MDEHSWLEARSLCSRAVIELPEEVNSRFKAFNIPLFAHVKRNPSTRVIYPRCETGETGRTLSGS